MTEHPITPPPELVKQWAVYKTGHESPVQLWHNVATEAARWGYQQGMDAELEACCEWFVYTHPDDRNLGALRTARRPKPPSLKQQALTELDSLENMGACNADTIRRALEALPE